MSFKWCQDCNNLIYPREDRTKSRLLYACRNCNHQELATDTNDHCVYVHVINQAAVDESLTSADITCDPTYPRLKRLCPKCGNNEALFYQSRAKGKDATMQLTFVCGRRECKFRWVNEPDVVVKTAGAL